MKTLKMSTRMRFNINKEADHAKIKKNLLNFVHIQDRHYHLIPVFSRIRYIDRESGDFYFGGIIISNKSPEKIIVRGIGFDSTWAIHPEKYSIFIEDHRVRKSIQSEKNNLYQLFCDGKLEFKIKDI